MWQARGEADKALKMAEEDRRKLLAFTNALKQFVCFFFPHCLFLSFIGPCRFRETGTEQKLQRQAGILQELEAKKNVLENTISETKHTMDEAHKDMANEQVSACLVLPPEDGWRFSPQL